MRYRSVYVLLIASTFVQPVLARALDCPESLARRLPVEAAIERPFGFRLHPVMGVAVFQPNIVFGTSSGRLVRAVMGGRVGLIEARPHTGKVVWVRQSDGSEQRYGPLSQIHVQTGRCVAAGAILGRTTSSPFTFSLKWKGRWIDPAPLLGDGQ